MIPNIYVSKNLFYVWQIWFTWTDINLDQLHHKPASLSFTSACDKFYEFMPVWTGTMEINTAGTLKLNGEHELAL